MTTLKGSKQGLAKIKQAREKKGWPMADRNWLEAASLFLGVDWEKTGYLAEGISEGTWSRFLAGKRAINANAFQAYCTVLELNWQEVVNRTQHLDWNAAPDLSSFYGRAKELATLKQWIVKDKCRLVTILGMEGIGKTALAVRTTEEIQDEFEYVIWRSLRYTPSIQAILADLLKFLSQEKTDLPDSIDSQISKLISYLHKHRCLVVLDDFETALKSGELAGRYCEGYEAFAEIIKRVGQERHQSCLVLTSAEKPREIGFWEGETQPVRSLSLTGLQEAEALKVLKLLNTAGISDRRSKEKIVNLFQQEAQVLSQLNHPGIPKGEGFSFPFWPKDSQEPLHCLVMEKIEGINLQSWLENRDNEPITQELAREWLKQLAEILHQVHQQNYFHRDIKPPNIMLTPEGQLVLIDFGAVREFTQTYLHQQNVTGTVIGSSGYAPPEQLRGRTAQQSDFFALGRTFVHLLTGKHPLDLQEDSQTGKLIWRNSIPHISKFGANFICKFTGRSLADFIDELMEPSWKKRPKNTQVILNSIKKIDRLPIPEIVGGSTLILTGAAAVFYWYLTGVQVCAKNSLRSFVKGDSLSCGEEILVQYSPLREKQAGVDAFFAERYSDAVSLLEKAWQKQHDPETLIYLNNARLKAQKAEAYTIGVIAPISDKNLDRALEILRGVAQAQDEYNRKRKLGEPGLKVAIANDDNNPAKGKQIAEALVSKRDILAVIGHYASDVTLEAMPVFEQHQLVLISPSSTSASLPPPGSRFFFRTVPSAQVNAYALATYLLYQSRQRTAAVYYDSKSIFSKSLRDQFVISFPTMGGKIIKEFDLYDVFFNPTTSINQAQKQGGTALVIFPDANINPHTFDNALKLIKINHGRYWMMGGDILYSTRTLEFAGQEAVNRLVVVVPWHHLSSPSREFSLSAEKLWGGEVSYRTALAYDAGMVLIAALRKNSQPNRLNVRQVLANPSFKAIGATGVVSFEPNGNRKEPVFQLVKVVPSKCSPYGYIFVPINYFKGGSLECGLRSTSP